MLSAEIWIEESFSQPSKASLPITVTPLPIETLSRLLLPKNAFAPIDVTPSGITIDFTFALPAKVPSAIVFTSSATVYAAAVFAAAAAGIAESDMLRIVSEYSWIFMAAALAVIFAGRRRQADEN